VGLDEQTSLARRRERLREIDDAGLLATPANSADNERVIEAARESLAKGGERVTLRSSNFEVRS
jgi:hypothetical protein